MMRGAGRLLALVLGTAALLVSAAAALHEEAFEARDWIPMARAGKYERVTFMLMLAHRVEHAEMHDTLMAVSDPASAEYGRHLSVDEIRERFSPAPEEAQEVLTWLGQGLPTGQYELNRQGDMIIVDAFTHELETLLQTELRWHRSRLGLSKQRYVRAVTSIRVPRHLHETIEMVSLNAAINGNYPKSGRKLRRAVGAYMDSSHAGTVSVTTGNGMVQARFDVICGDLTANMDATPCSSLPAIDQPVITATVTNVRGTVPPSLIQLENSMVQCFRTVSGSITTTPCNGNSSDCTCVANVGPISMYETYTLDMSGTFSNDNVTLVVDYGNSTIFTLTDVATPYFLYDLYDVPYGITVRNNATNAVPEFYDQFYSPTDLATFFDMCGMDEYAVTDDMFGDQGVVYDQPGGEAQLDVEYILALSPGANLSFYSMSGRNPYSSENEPFLSWLYIVGNETDPPAVQSVSYGDVEASIFNASKPGSSSYGFACSNQFMLMGMRGITVLIASGDDGVSSLLGPSACPVSVPEWPASDPYITAVGATQLTTEYLPFCEGNYDGTLVDLPVQCTSTHETMCSSDIGGIITSGGGFSNIFDRNTYAPYQNDAVEAYLARTDIVPPASFFNSSGRAYPDISAYGSNYFVYLNSTIVRESGTSASTPVIAGIITLLNDMRAGYNLPTLGFLNPWLYQIGASTPEVFQDVTTGSNNCTAGHGNSFVCCENAFTASAQWDAVTGWGTPSFQALSVSALNSALQYPTITSVAVDGKNGTDGADGTDGSGAANDDADDGSSGQGNNDDDGDDDDSDGRSDVGLASGALTISLLATILSLFGAYKTFQK